MPLKEILDGSRHQKLGPHPGKLDKNKKSIKNLTICRIADQQKAWKQGRDDSIKQFSTQLHPTYL